MSASKIKADYEQLTQVAKIFEQNSVVVAQQVLQRMMNGVEKLQGGDWAGIGADVFYSEMNNEVMPAISSLSEAMAQAATSVTQISQRFKQAEEDAAPMLLMTGENDTRINTSNVNKLSPLLNNVSGFIPSGIREQKNNDADRKAAVEAARLAGMDTVEYSGAQRLRRIRDAKEKFEDQRSFFYDTAQEARETLDKKFSKSKILELNQKTNGKLLEKLDEIDASSIQIRLGLQQERTAAEQYAAALDKNAVAQKLIEQSQLTTDIDSTKVAIEALKEKSKKRLEFAKTLAEIALNPASKLSGIAQNGVMDLAEEFAALPENKDLRVMSAKLSVLETALSNTKDATRKAQLNETIHSMDAALSETIASRLNTMNYQQKLDHVYDEVANLEKVNGGGDYFQAARSYRKQLDTMSEHTKQIAESYAHIMSKDETSNRYYDNSARISQWDKFYSDQENDASGLVNNINNGVHLEPINQSIQNSRDVINGALKDF